MSAREVSTVRGSPEWAPAGVASGRAVPTRAAARVARRPARARMRTLADAGRLAAVRPSMPGHPRGRDTHAARSVRTASLLGRRGTVLLVTTTLLAAAIAAGGAALALAALAVLGAGALTVRDARLRRRAEARRRALRDAVALLVAELEAGTSPPEAFAAAAAAVGTAHGDLATGLRLAAEVEPGHEVAVAEHAETARLPRELVGVRIAWAAARTTGAPLANLLSRVEADLAATASRERAVSVVLAGPRASALLLAGLPVLGIVLGTAMGAHPLALLLGDGAGRWLCCLGCVFDALGVLWTRRIVSRAER